MKTRIVYKTLRAEARYYRFLIKWRFLYRVILKGFREAFRLEDQDRIVFMKKLTEDMGVFTPIGLFIARLQEFADLNNKPLDYYNIYWHLSKALLTDSTNGLDLIGKLLTANDPDTFYKWLRVIEADGIRPINNPLSDNWTLFAWPHTSGRIIVLPSRDHM